MSEHTGISEEELAAIDAWGAARLAEHEAEDAYSVFPCEYDSALPTHSIRSQLLRLVAEVRRLRAIADDPYRNGPSAIDMVHQLMQAVYGSSWARPESPEMVWNELLAEVRRLRAWGDTQ